MSSKLANSQLWDAMYLAILFVFLSDLLTNNVERPETMDLLDLDGNSMSTATSMDQTSLSFSKTATIKTGEQVIQQELLAKHHYIGLIHFVD